MIIIVIIIIAVNPMAWMMWLLHHVKISRMTWTWYHEKIWLLWAFWLKARVTGKTCHNCTKHSHGGWFISCGVYEGAFALSPSINKWNVVPLSTEEHAISMLRIIFLHAVTHNAGCISENWIWKNKNYTYNKILLIVLFITLSY